jgi:hypothetical protein
MTIRPQRIKIETVDLLEGKNIIQGYIEQKINMGDLFRFIIRLGETEVSLESAGKRGLIMIVNKFNTRESQQLPSKGPVRVQLHPEDIRPVSVK